MTTDLTILKETPVDMTIPEGGSISLNYKRIVHATPDAVGVVVYDQQVLDMKVDEEIRVDKAIIFRLCSDEHGIEDAIGGAFCKCTAS